MAKRQSIQSERSEKTQRLLEVSTQRKALEKEEDVLKEWFEKDCNGVPTVYEYGDAVVETGIDSRTSVNAKAVRADHGEKYDQTSTFMKIVARPAKPVKRG